MVVGAWIARDAVRLRIPWPLRTVALLLTFLAGPVGFLLHLVARMALLTLQMDGSLPAMPQRLLEKHFFRKHGPGAYYGQG